MSTSSDTYIEQVELYGRCVECLVKIEKDDGRKIRCRECVRVRVLETLAEKYPRRFVIKIL